MRYHAKVLERQPRVGLHWWRVQDWWCFVLCALHGCSVMASTEKWRGNAEKYKGDDVSGNATSKWNCTHCYIQWDKFTSVSQEAG